MKTKHIKKSVITFGSFLLVFVLFTNTITAQEIQVKGIVKGKTAEKTELLNGANVFLKGTKTGTFSSKKGEFTFPQNLKVGDILEFSYLGFIKKTVKITATTKNIVVVLNEDYNQMLGALNSNKRFKSKRLQK